LSGTISTSGVSSLEEIVQYLEEEYRNDCLSVMKYATGYNFLIVQIAYFYTLRKMCPEVKLFAADEVGRFLKECLEEGYSILKILTAYSQRTFLHEPVLTMEAAFPVIGFISKQDPRTANLAMYAQVDPENNSLLQVLKFLHEHGLAIQWQKLYSLDAVMNWNYKYHPYTKKTYLLQPHIQFQH
jgi:hypothetical protein